MSDHSRESSGRGAPALWATAFVLGAMVVAQAGRIGARARAEMVSHRGDFTIMTADAGVEDVLVALDGRSGSLLVYKMQNGRTLELLQRVGVDQMFIDARRATGAGPR
jgi:hypothetical protein